MNPLLVICLFILSSSPFGAHGQEPKNTSKTKIAFIGDSITDGYGVEKSSAFPALLETALNKKGYPVVISNGAVSGALSSAGVDQLQWQLRSNPQIVVITLGGNDARQGTPPVDIETNLIRTIELAKKNGAQVILGGMKIFRNLGPKYVREFEAIYPRVAKKENVILVPFLLESVGGVPAMNQADGFHPNEKGHRKISENLLPYLERLLRSKKSAAL